jgi:hypothetical protein
MARSSWIAVRESNRGGSGSFSLGSGDGAASAVCPTRRLAPALGPVPPIYVDVTAFAHRLVPSRRPQRWLAFLWGGR